MAYDGIVTRRMFRVHFSLACHHPPEWTRRRCEVPGLFVTMDCGAPFFRRKGGILRVGILRGEDSGFTSSRPSTSHPLGPEYGADTTDVLVGIVDEHGEAGLRSNLVEMWIWL